jgi:hypothetical protein
MPGGARRTRVFKGFVSSSHSARPDPRTGAVLRG